MATDKPEGQPQIGDPSTTLRLVWPEWQGAASAGVGALLPNFPLDFARRGYLMGAQVLDAVLPRAGGPVAVVDVPVDDRGTEIRGGIEARDAVSAQLGDALAKIQAANPERILTLGGDCAVSVAPFSYLGAKYPEDVAVIWVDSHPDVDTEETTYLGYHAMAVSALLGRGAKDVASQLPYTFPADRIALVGLHAWEPDSYEHVEKWGLAQFGPEALRGGSDPLLDWLQETGCSRIAIHFDVDAVDSGEATFGLGPIPGGLSGEETRRVIQDLSGAADVVGFTVAEFIPRQVMQLLQVLGGLPLID